MTTRFAVNENKETIANAWQQTCHRNLKSESYNFIFLFLSCSHDSSLRYVYKKSPVQKFTFQAFRFRDVVSKRLYVHCKVVTCRRSDTGSVCDRGCTKDRRHRRENKRIIMDKDVFLSLGPVKFQDQGEGQYE